jgi:hypothetical protein
MCRKKFRKREGLGLLQNAVPFAAGPDPERRYETSPANRRGFVFKQGKNYLE